MPLRCLIVDDNSLFLQGAVDLLTREGLDVVGVATDSAEAIRLVTELEPEVMLVDIDLGDDDGFQLTQRLHAVSGDLKVILVSTHAEDDLAHLIERSSAIGFIAKACLSADAIRDTLERAA